MVYYIIKAINMISIKIINYVKNTKLKLRLLKILNNKTPTSTILKKKKLNRQSLKITN